MSKVFNSPGKSIPKGEGDKNVVRVAMDKSDLGARKSFLSGIKAKSPDTMSIRHVKG
jgi:hypothetical protein